MAAPAAMRNKALGQELRGGGARDVAATRHEAEPQMQLAETALTPAGPIAQGREQRS